MRWICKDDIEGALKSEWRGKAAIAEAEIKAAATAEERRRILGRHSDVWRDFFSRLPENLKKKCWYCEAEEIRSDQPVDHFRPKNKIEGDEGHDGYWWLAFDWENYRCACTYCNSRRKFDETEGGKQCQFPIFNPDKRAYGPLDDLTAEEPAFLDPFDPDDEKLLWFDGDGKPEPSSRALGNQIAKVENSIKIFHLDQVKIVRRRNQLRIEVQRRVEALQRAISSNDTTTCRAEKSYLRKIVRATEPLSRAAIVYLSAYREIPEIEEILQLA